MKKVLGTIAILAAAMPLAAQAADLPPAPAPAYKAPVVVPEVWSWSGFYIGINGGYGWNETTGDNSCVNPAGVTSGVGCWTAQTGTVKPAGGLVGGTAGFNYQMGTFVWGIETDLQWSDIKDSQSVTAPCCLPALLTPGTLSTSQSLDWFGTARGRLGFAAGPALFYGTGGLIYGQEAVSSLVSFPTGVTYPVSASSTRVGWTAGAGIEYMFNPHFTAKLEGLYYDMGSQTISATSTVPGYVSNTTFNYQGVIVRAGLNWKFDWGGPVVARY